MDRHPKRSSSLRRRRKKRKRPEEEEEEEEPPAAKDVHSDAEDGEELQQKQPKTERTGPSSRQVSQVEVVTFQDPRKKLKTKQTPTLDKAPVRQVGRFKNGMLILSSKEIQKIKGNSAANRCVVVVLVEMTEGELRASRTSLKVKVCVSAGEPVNPSRMGKHKRKRKNWHRSADSAHCRTLFAAARGELNAT
ncbi:hypothetical protein GBF38_006258 [Nibea albiflora]|uniref:Uncharacterized protein n=1 Tax=Nibea albiflora TaxID=240163 RepID=A0ACB7FB83_NIBAL|nr:hypothetical protein GBF38_006258 [Nibea albiflora]